VVSLLELLDLFLGSLVLEGKEVGVLLEGGFGELALPPEIRGQVCVGAADGEEGRLDEVTHGLGSSLGLGVYIAHTSELEHLLGDTSCDDTGSTGGGDETHGHGSTLSGNLHGNSVWVSDHVTPISTAHGHDSQLGDDDSTTDGGGNFLRAFDAQTNMTIRVTDDNEGLETGPLSSTGLLLDGHDFHHLILQLSFRGGEEEVYYLILLHGEGEQVDFF